MAKSVVATNELNIVALRQVLAFPEGTDGVRFIIEGGIDRYPQTFRKIINTGDELAAHESK